MCSHDPTKSWPESITTSPVDDATTFCAAARPRVPALSSATASDVVVTAPGEEAPERSSTVPAAATDADVGATRSIDLDALRTLPW